MARACPGIALLDNEAVVAFEPASDLLDFSDDQMPGVGSSLTVSLGWNAINTSRCWESFAQHWNKFYAKRRPPRRMWLLFNKIRIFWIENFILVVRFSRKMAPLWGDYFFRGMGMNKHGIPHCARIPQTLSFGCDGQGRTVKRSESVRM